MKKLKTSSKGSQKSIEVSGCSTQIAIQTNQELTLEDQVYGSHRITDRENKLYRKSNRYQLLRKEHQNFKEIFMGQLLEELFRRRKRYSLQMVKLKYMFPDDSFSESMSVNSYDRLFYNDEHIHTIVKIYETKEMEAKIWAFINLMNLHKKKKLQKFTAKIEKVHHRLIGTEFRSSFDRINQFSIKIKPSLNSKLQPSKVVIQRQQAITTRVQHPRAPQQPIKTQRVTTANTVNTNAHIKTDTNSTRDSNEVIRISTLESSPIVKRIELAPESVRIYPTSIPQTIRTNSTHGIHTRNTYETKQVRDTRDIARTQIVSPSTQNNETTRVRYVNESESRVIFPSRTHFGSQKRLQYTRPSTVHEVQSVSNFVTIPINTSPVYYTRPAEVREVNRNYHGLGYGQEALVHTVHGDCTINIHNYCEHSRQGVLRDRAEIIQDRNRSMSKREHTRQNSRQQQNYESFQIDRSSNRMLDGYGSQYYLGNQVMRSHCSVHCCQPVCSCIHGCSQHHEHTRGKPYRSDYYNLEERIQYMKHLEHLCQQNFAHSAKNVN